MILILIRLFIELNLLNTVREAFSIRMSNQIYSFPTGLYFRLLIRINKTFHKFCNCISHSIFLFPNKLKISNSAPINTYFLYSLGAKLLTDMYNVQTKVLLDKYIFNNNNNKTSIGKICCLFLAALHIFIKF